MYVKRSGQNMHVNTKISDFFLSFVIPQCPLYQFPLTGNHYGCVMSPTERDAERFRPTCFLELDIRELKSNSRSYA